jgi:MFS transporter, FSR family, fosmidomycin resistance protein
MTSPDAALPPATTPESDVRAQRRTLATCCGAHALHDGLVDMLYVLLPILAQAYGLSYAQVGLIRAANKAAMSLFQIPAGLLAESMGERNLLAFGTLCTGVAFIGLGASSGFYPILILLFIAGFGAAFQHPLCSSLVSKAYTAQRRRGGLGTYNFAGDVGKFAFAGLLSLALAAGLSWEAPVIAAGGLGVAIAVLILICLPRLTQTRPEETALVETLPKGTTPADQSSPPSNPGWGIRNRTGFSALCGIAVIDSATRSGFLTFIAFLMIEKGVPSGLATIAIPVVFVGGMVGKLACGFLADRIGVIRTVVLTELATGGGILLALVLPNLAAFALLPLIGIALNGTSSVLYGTIGDLVDSERQSRAFGLFYTLGSVCGILAPLGYGLLGDWIGITETLAIVGAVVFLTIPLCLALRPAIAAHSHP